MRWLARIFALVITALSGAQISIIAMESGYPEWFMTEWFSFVLGASLGLLALIAWGDDS